MNNKMKYLFILVLILVSISLVVTYGYFSAVVVSNNVNDFSVKSGKLDIRINDTSVNSEGIRPIHDADYLNESYKKDFQIISDSSINACSKVYLHINEISEGLKNEYFKYRLISDNVDISGNFENANNTEELLLLGNLYLEGGKTKYFNLYMWVSYQDDVDQMEMLGTRINAYLVINGVDVKNENMCK